MSNLGISFAILSFGLMFFRYFRLVNLCSTVKKVRVKIIGRKMNWRVLKRFY